MLTDYPKTADEWWYLLDENKDQLRSLVSQFYPMGAKSTPDFPITAKKAEVVCEEIRSSISEERGKEFDPVATFDYATKERDGETLVKILDETWFGMPESQFVQQIEGFGALCDLCSESYLILGDEDE